MPDRKTFDIKALDAMPAALSGELCQRIENDRARGWINPFRTGDADAERRVSRPSGPLLSGI